MLWDISHDSQRLQCPEEGWAVRYGSFILVEKEPVAIKAVEL